MGILGDAGTGVHIRPGGHQRLRRGDMVGHDRPYEGRGPVAAFGRIDVRAAGDEPFDEVRRFRFRPPSINNVWPSGSVASAVFGSAPACNSASSAARLPADSGERQRRDTVAVDGVRIRARAQQQRDRAADRHCGPPTSRRWCRRLRRHSHRASSRATGARRRPAPPWRPRSHRSRQRRRVRRTRRAPPRRQLRRGASSAMHVARAVLEEVNRAGALAESRHLVAALVRHGQPEIADLRPRRQHEMTIRARPRPRPPQSSAADRSRARWNCPCRCR